MLQETSTVTWCTCDTTLNTTTCTSASTVKGATFYWGAAKAKEEPTRVKLSSIGTQCCFFVGTGFLPWAVFSLCALPSFRGYNHLQDVTSWLMFWQSVQKSGSHSYATSTGKLYPSLSTVISWKIFLEKFISTRIRA